ncbi:MAG TPA: phasin family protein [Burkholderiales bacterium]|nr:phasin family protein [Burkholderiales bacterium]
MYVTSKQLQALGQANLETMLSLAFAQVSMFEKLAGLNVASARTAFEESLAGARALANAKDAQEVLELQNAVAQPAIENAFLYSRKAYEIAAETNAELSRTSAQRIAHLNENFVSLLDQAARNAPAGSEVAVSAVKQLIGSVNYAYGNLNQIAKQAGDIVEANIEAASKAVKRSAEAQKAA